MSDTDPTPTPPTHEEALAAAPAPRLRRRRLFSIVWLIPLVAAIAAAWMAYDAAQSQGPLITIRMENAEGIVPGKTKIRFKDVEVGQVEKVEFDRDLLHVTVTARMSKSMERFLRSQTLFWVVRARVTPSEVTGLSTLFSGAYIGVQPTRKGKLMTEFTALEEPPVLTDERQGRHFLLTAQTLGSLDIGSPVYFRKVNVGKVVRYRLRDDDTLEVKIFVQSPHHKRVRANTRFWNASGLDLSMDARGVRMEAESLVTMLFGGIAFDTPDDGAPSDPAASGTEFALYPSREASLQKAYAFTQRYLLYFDESVRGLHVGAPVEFRGMEVGRVADIKLSMDTRKQTVRIPVVIEIEPERFELTGGEGDHADTIEAMVAMGLRAQLKTGSLITGQSYVDLDLHPDRGPAGLVAGGRYPELPTLPSPLEGLMASAQRIMNKLERVPLSDVATEMRTTMAEIRYTLGKMRTTMDDMDDMDILPKTSQALTHANNALAEIESTLAPDSMVRTDLQRLLREMGDTARSLRVLADYLERQPDALLYGKGAEQ